MLAVTAESAPFLAAKLSIKVLPFVLAYRNGVEVARIVGFEGLALPGGSDFSVASMEEFLYKHGVIHRRTKNHQSGRIGASLSDESDLDLDD